MMTPERQKIWYFERRTRSLDNIDSERTFMSELTNDKKKDQADELRKSLVFL